MDSAAAWARYMALDGGARHRARVVALQYVDGGADMDEGTTGGAARSPPGGQLLSVDIAAAGTGAFGDDLAIECLAAAYGRDVYVVRWRTTSSPALCLERMFVCFPGAAPRRSAPSAQSLQL